MDMPEMFLGMPMPDPCIYSMLLSGVLVSAVMAVDLAVLGIIQSVPELRKVILARQTAERQE